ncbi:DNA-3-methyladenine glycosylase [Candidatus Kaiserbacteria bacterium]|nr:DNA-3-methyladenine glycosylase [Candidatus Kaiserbacteria bacterium]
MAVKLPKSIYQGNAIKLAPKLLGKYLVHRTKEGIISGMITDVEAYPAFADEVSHGNRKTKRTEVMYWSGGYGYVYKIYGIHCQFAVVVNRENVPEVVFIRAVESKEGIELMRKNFGRKVEARVLARSPGNLCKSFGISEELYGVDLTGNTLYLEDRGARVGKRDIQTSFRVGINNRLQGSERKLRYFLRRGAV